MEFLKLINKRRSLVSEIVYIVLNIALAITLMLIVRYTGSLVPALILVLLSKWRVLAVRVRFWAANIQANSICFIVSLSYVIFLYSANPVPADSSDMPSLLVQGALTLLYIGWLILLKPQSKRVYIALQSGVALFTGITAIFMISYGWIAAPVVALVWLVGYSAAWHIFNSYDEDHIILLSMTFGLVMAEIGWLAYHWTIAYSLPLLSSILIPQVSIVAICTGFLAYKAYNSYFHHQKIRMAEVLLPLIFAVSLVGVLVLFRNGIEQIIF